MSDTTMMTYGPANNLFQAATTALAAVNSGLGDLPDAVKEALTRALEECEGAVKDRQAYASEIEKAREKYATDEVEIDDDPVTSAGDEGVWVSAWVWMPYDGPKLENLMVVWRDEATICVTFNPLPEDGYDDSQVMSSVEAFLNDRASVKELVMDGAGENYVGARIEGLRINELNQLGVPVLDGRDS